MNPKGDKLVRFADWRSERKARPFFRAAGDSVRSSCEFGSERIRSGKKILDPQGQFVQTWNKIFVLVCIFAVAIDCFFFYIPVVESKNKCLDLDKKLEITACLVRTFIDVVYILHIVFQFRTGFIAPSSRVFGTGELVDDPAIIAKRYLTSFFLIDILAILPLPQVVILIIIPSLTGSVPLVAKNVIKFVILSQYVPRLIRIYPLHKEVTRTGILTEIASIGAAYNLVLYMLASHVIGAFWYLFSIEREVTCWREACHNHTECDSRILYCGNHKATSDPFWIDSCPFIQPDDIKGETTFNFGIFVNALDSHIVESKDFPKKLFYCFWWGLRNLSSLGQNLETSTFVGEILFAICISIVGLVLFSLFIGNMQKHLQYLQSATVRMEEMRVRKEDAEQWMSDRMLPESLRERIRRYEQYKWQKTRGVEEQSLIRNLPKDLRRDINRHLCMDLLLRVPMFEKMDEQILDAVCDRLRPALYTEDSYVVREGDPVDEMIFIMRGNLVSTTTNGGRTGFFSAVHLKAGDFCGEGLFTWALDPQSSSILPISTRTVRALTEVEAFALVADDLKSVAAQFRRLHRRDIQHTFRYCSVQWRTWAACFIQAAWRRHYRRRQAKALHQEEDKLQDLLVHDAGASPSLGVTIYASQFAANALKNLRQHATRTTPRLPQILPLLPQKPAEPDFSAQGH